MPATAHRGARGPEPSRPSSNQGQGPRAFRGAMPPPGVEVTPAALLSPASNVKPSPRPAEAEATAASTSGADSPQPAPASAEPSAAAAAATATTGASPAPSDRSDFVGGTLAGLIRPRRED